MRIAITADAHLTSREQYPGRFEAMEDIFRQSVEMDISQVIIAGDLFDREMINCSEFEELCQCFPGLHLHIIPGNHDTGISGKAVICRNISVYREPETVDLEDVTILFVPYEENRIMGSSIALQEEFIKGRRWVLVGHGDYHGGIKQRNPYEPGTYMPLSSNDISRFDPWRVFLGHIHKQTDQGRVHYPGSPCGLDINETGPRRFLVLDTADGSVTPYTIATDVIYFSESFIVLPGDREIERLERDIQTRISSWGLAPGDADRVRLRVRAAGYSSDRQAVLDTLTRGFADFTWHDDGPDLSDLNISDDRQLGAVADRTREIIEQLEWDYGDDEPGRSMIVESALRVIYGEGGS